MQTVLGEVQWEGEEALFGPEFPWVEKARSGAVLLLRRFERLKQYFQPIECVPYFCKCLWGGCHCTQGCFQRRRESWR